MSSSELTEFSSSPLSDDDIPENIPKGKLEHYFKQGLSALPPKVKKKRPPSPPHEYVLADNSDIAFICMFRSRFNSAFPKSLPHYGPQDIERGVVDSLPGEPVERLLCALLSLLLNRKKEVEKGHYSRALEEAIQTHSNQWAPKWEGKNPLHGGGSFNTMGPEERLTLLRTLIMWCLDSSEAVRDIIRDSYKQARHEDDLNQPLSVQPWGQDGDKRRFWLIEGQDDTYFRLYRESNPLLKLNTWRSVAGSIDEVKTVAGQLTDENSQAGRRLSDRILAAIPRFEASDDKRKRRDYRIARRAQFTRPEHGFSLYEGRTRGKRIKYTYSDEEDGGSDAKPSARQSGISTPAEPSGPMYTASGRQVRSRHGGAYGESMTGRQQEIPEDDLSEGIDDPNNGEEDESTGPRGRSTRAARSSVLAKKAGGGKHIEGYNSLDEMEDESDATSSGNEWDGADEDEPDDQADDEDEEEGDIEMSDEERGSLGDDESDEEHRRRSRSLVVSLRYSKNTSSSKSQPLTNGTSNEEHSNGLPVQAKSYNHDDKMEDVHEENPINPSPPAASSQPHSLPLKPISSSPDPHQRINASAEKLGTAQTFELPTDTLNNPHASVFDRELPPNEAAPVSSLDPPQSPPAPYH